jgi:hypothetical protein
MSLQIEVELQIDTAHLLAALSELELNVNRLGELPHRVRKLALAIRNLPSKLVRLEMSPAAVGAVLVALEPGDGLLDLLAACRARDGHGFFVEGEGGHD